MLSYVSWVSISLLLRFQANNGNIMPKSLIAQNASSRIGWKTAKKTGSQAGRHNTQRIWSGKFCAREGPETWNSCVCGAGNHNEISILCSALKTQLRALKGDLFYVLFFRNSCCKVFLSNTIILLSCLPLIAILRTQLVYIFGFLANLLNHVFPRIISAR